MAPTKKIARELVIFPLCKDACTDGTLLRIIAAENPHAHSAQLAAVAAELTALQKTDEGIREPVRLAIQAYANNHLAPALIDKQLPPLTLPASQIAIRLIRYYAAEKALQMDKDALIERAQKYNLQLVDNDSRRTEQASTNESKNACQCACTMHALKKEHMPASTTLPPLPSTESNNMSPPLMSTSVLFSQQGTACSTHWPSQLSNIANIEYEHRKSRKRDRIHSQSPSKKAKISDAADKQQLISQLEDTVHSLRAQVDSLTSEKLQLESDLKAERLQVVALRAELINTIDRPFNSLQTLAGTSNMTINGNS